MNLADRIPRDFYRVFNSKYMEYYQLFLVKLYEESSRSFSLLGLTESECRQIMNEQIARVKIDWSKAQSEEEGELLTSSNMASVCLKNLINWGWLRRDFDETLNAYVVSFPEYSQLFVELFARLFSEDSTKERESVLAVYSYLYTYSNDAEKNNEILKSALFTAHSLLQMLAGMQEGMRGYFDELSRQKSFLGIQEVLVKEINNSDSKKYAILTTTDSFYRYKEAVKELIDKNLTENELRRESFLCMEVPEGNEIQLGKRKRALERCDEAEGIIYQIEREFDVIERRYNNLIRQKTVFASRAAARIRYILLEGARGEDRTVKLVGLLNRANDPEEILGKLAEGMRLTERFKLFTDESMTRRKRRGDEAFAPEKVEEEITRPGDLGEFILNPIYTDREVREFYRKHSVNGRFSVSEQSVRSIEDLEKLFFVWQEATEIADEEKEITVGEDVTTKDGFRFSKLSISE